MTKRGAWVIGLLRIAQGKGFTLFLAPVGQEDFEEFEVKSE